MISNSDMLGMFTIPFEHGLLVVEDSATRARHDEWNPAVERVHVEDGSIYLSVQADVDGPVAVEVYDSSMCDGVTFTDLIERYNGEIPVRSKLRISDSDNIVVMSLHVHGDRLRVQCLVDDDQWPSRVVIIIDQSLNVG